MTKDKKKKHNLTLTKRTNGGCKKQNTIKKRI